MTRLAIKAASGLFVMVGILAAASPASAQKRWANAKNKAEVLAVAGGITCPTAGHGACYEKDGQQLVVWNSATPDTYWFTPATSDTDVIESEYADSLGRALCIGVANASTTSGANLVIWPCNGDDNQYWTVWPASDWNIAAPGCYVFQDNDGQLMAVAGGNVTNGSHVVQRIANPTTATLDMAWCPE